MDYVHHPVLLDKVLELLAPASEGSIFVDGTLGEGGHAEQFLERFPDMHLWGVDADVDIQARAVERLRRFGARFHPWSGWSDDFFREFPPGELADRILIDLGISIFHYERSGRGFSFALDEPLDMRLRTDEGESAADYLARVSKADLEHLLFEYGEERYGRRIASAILEERGRKGSRGMAQMRARDLAELIFTSVPVEYRHGRIHPATRTFQALRIQVNDELVRLPALLQLAFDRLAVGGRLGLISFHSLEDRIVKHFFRSLAAACVCPPELPRCECGGKPRAIVLTKKPVEADEDECRANPPSRSAKLRVVEKLGSERPQGERE